MDNPRVKRRFLDSKQGQIHIRIAEPASSGQEKPAIICLHMMPKSGRIFASVMPDLASGRVVVAIDYPGYGESDPYSGNLTPSIVDYAASVMQVIQMLSLTRVDLVGYHTGSMVAVELAAQHSDMVNKVINISAPLFTEREVQDFQQYFAPVPLDDAGTRFSQMWQRVLQYRGPGMTLEMAAVSMAENLRGGERYEDGHRAAFDYSRIYAQRLRKLAKPLLVINPGDDLHEHSKRVDELLSDSRRVDCPEWGHGFLELWPHDVAKLMLNFLDE